jgi:hypothetical protein
MIPTTYAGTAAYLLSAEPSGDVKVTVSRLTERHAGRTRVEERRILGATLRWALQYPVLIDQRAAAQAFRLALTSYDNRPILCPCWPAAVPYGQAALFDGGLKCTWEPDFSRWEFHTGAAPGGYTAAAKTAPVLWGRFDKLPDPDLVTTEVPSLTISFAETGPAAYAVAPAASAAAHQGPSLHGQTWPLLDFEVDYQKTGAGGVDVQVDRQRIGYGRDEAETFYPQTPRRPVRATIAGTPAEAARLIATFHACAGTVAPLWFPSAYQPTRLTANPSASDVHLQVEDATALGGYAYILLRDGAGGANVARQVVAAAGQQLTLNAAPGAMPYGSTSLQLLLFGRFSSDDLSLTWSPAFVTAQCTLIELPPDYSTPAGETFGTTVGKVGAPIFLFEIADQIGGTWYWTNYESAVTVGGHTYEPHQIAWDRITQKLNLDDGKVTLTVDSWEGNPCMRLCVPRRGQQLTLVLKEWDAAGGAVTTHWTGYASSAKARGKTLSIPFTGEGRIFEIRVPRRLDGPTCPWVIFGPGCELDPAAFAVATTGASQPATLSLVVNLAGTFAVHYFAGGWIRRTIAGEGSPTYAVLDSTASSGGQLTLTIDMPLSPPLQIGEAFTLYPGCDQTWDTCTARGNTAKFGGQPRKPAANPAFVAVKQTTPVTSKK